MLAGATRLRSRIEFSPLPTFGFPSPPHLLWWVRAEGLMGYRWQLGPGPVAPPHPAGRLRSLTGGASITSGGLFGSPEVPQKLSPLYFSSLPSSENNRGSGRQGQWLRQPLFAWF